MKSKVQMGRKEQENKVIQQYIGTIIVKPKNPFKGQDNQWFKGKV